MSLNPTEHRNIQYNDSVTYELIQKPGLLYPLCGSSDNYAGSKSARIENRFDHMNMEEKEGRNADTSYTDLDSLARWIRPGKKGDIASLIERDDLDVTQVDIDSPLSVQTALAARRWHDDEFLLGYYGNAYQGESGETAVPFASGNVIPHGSTGLTYAKILAVKEAMGLADNDTEEEMPVWLITPKQQTNLFNMDEYKNWDFTPNRALSRGELVKDFMGFRWIKFNPDSPKAYKRGGALTKSGSTRRCPVFMPSGLHRGIWTEFWGKIAENPSKRFNEQVYGEARSAVTRSDEAKCFIAECTEA